MNIHSKVNDEYILTIQKDNLGFLELKTIPINKPIIKELKELVNNDSKTVYDLQCRFTRDYKYQSNFFRLCLPYIYISTYLEPIKYPEIKPLSELKRRWDEEYDRIRKGQSEQSAKNVLQSTHYYQKTNFYDECLKWINAIEYINIVNKVEKDNTIKMFSTDDIGWRSHTYKISDDVVVTVRTNFGYGLSSYFMLSVEYQGVPIIPYSVLVHYYHANTADLINCTRNYEVDRNNWESVLKFVVDICNQARSNPEEFIKEWVIKEIEDMMDGLRLLHYTPNLFFDKLKERPYRVLELNVKELKGVGIFSADDNRMYRAYGDDVVFLFEVDKITGALHVMDSMKKIASKCDSLTDIVNNHIHTILDYNYQLYPRMKSKTKEYESKIEEYSEICNKKHEELQSMMTKMANLKQQLEIALADEKDPAKRKTITDDFLMKYPLYSTISEKIAKLMLEHQQISQKISDYRGYVDLLKKAIGSIDAVREKE